MKNAALYARVSTKHQDPGAQLLELRDYAGRRGLEVFEYSDVGVSGSKNSRPALDHLMRSARLKLFDVVIVARFDRFARSTRHLVEALEEFQALGIDFISLGESIDTSTPMGKMVFTVLGAVAELERNIIRERVRSGIARARSKGKQLGRPKRIIDRVKVAQLFCEGRTVTQLSARYAVSRRTILRILKGSEAQPDQAGKNPFTLFAHSDSFQTGSTELIMKGKTI